MIGNALKLIWELILQFSMHAQVHYVEYEVIAQIVTSDTQNHFRICQNATKA